LGPADLGSILSKLHLSPDENLLVGASTSDDAAVYKLSETIALVSTLDFFTPMLDDPYDFGRVAAANALSDVYAMGGKPLLALNIVAFPRSLSLGILEAILAGGAAVVAEAGARLAGGHSIADDTPMYGLAVNGIVHPQRIWTNRGARPGDVLVLTKPLGSGILCTAIKAGIADPDHRAKVVEVMTTLNSRAAVAASSLDVHACTDVTGFGLVGHLLEMLGGDQVSAQVKMNSIPVISGTRNYAKLGLVPGGAHRNRKHWHSLVIISQDLPKWDQDILFDPQTSGGLLLSLPEKQAENLVNHGIGSIIGQVIPRDKNQHVLEIC
jgi:selenide, water dikinase